MLPIFTYTGLFCLLVYCRDTFRSLFTVVPRNDLCPTHKCENFATIFISSFKLALKYISFTVLRLIYPNNGRQ